MPSISFNNTEVAFAHKSNAELKKARLLFQSFNYPLLIKYGPGIAASVIEFISPVKTIIKNTLFAQFCGGESIEDCAKAISTLTANNIGTILDYSVEGEETEEVFDYTCKEVILTIVKAAEDRKNIPFSVFKITGIGRMDLLTKVNAGESINESEQAEFERIKNRFSSICKAASEHDVKLFVDAEDSWIQDVIDDLTYDAMALYNQEKAIIFNTVQCYRTGRVAHIQRKLSELNCYLGFKLVRGAYMEKERERASKMGYQSPIQPDKIGSDKEYNDAIAFCVEHIDRVSICAGTHNEESALYLVDLMEKKNIAKFHPHIYFAQLLGMSDHISFNLAHAGYNVAKYVPYGPVKAVLPYLSRRAQENSSVKGQVGRELSLISQELKRRK
jgi:proline dehydrogenase